MAQATTSVTGNSTVRVSFLKRLNSSQGFTLLEICIVTFIIILFLGLTIPTASSLFSERQLQEPASQLQLFAKTARRKAVEDSHPYQINFSDKGYTLISIQTDPQTGKTKTTKLFDYELPSGTTFLIQRWNDKAFKDPKNEQWVFQPSGLLEPIQIKYKRGKSWMQFTFHPLTANIQDESSYFPN